MKSLKFGFILLAIMITSSCGPRIELDLRQWGDHAFLDNVQVFKLDVDEDAHLAEWQMYGDAVTGVRQIIISQGNAVIDSSNFVATVQLKAGNNLERTGLLFYFHGKRIEPMSGAPLPGVASDLKANSFTYRVFSSDGTYHDWKVVIEL